MAQIRNVSGAAYEVRIGVPHVVSVEPDEVFTVFDDPDVIEAYSNQPLLYQPLSAPPPPITPAAVTPTPESEED